jgi:hypothetical protein
MAPVAGRAMLNRVIDRLWADGQQQDRTQDQKELRSITLRFLRTLDLDVACCAAWGCRFDVWRERSAARKEYLNGMFREVSSQRASASLLATHALAFKGMPAPQPIPVGEANGRPAPAHQQMGDRQATDHPEFAKALQSPEGVAEHSAPSR